MIELLVAADDRTGALEVAGACVDGGLGPVKVVTGASLPPSATAAVIDLGSRHLGAREAAAGAVAVEGIPCRWAAHKIDSTLRGNWARELVARQDAGGRPVLLVPAFPAAGRTCVGGVVREHGRPVDQATGESDVRSPVTSSRPADHLHAVGAAAVTELASHEDLEAWAAKGLPALAVSDAACDEDLARLGRWAAARPDVLMAGTSAAIGALAAAIAAAAWPGTAPVPIPPVLTPPVLVANGSLHPAAAEQVAAAERLGVVVVDPVDPGPALAALAAGQPAILATGSAGARRVEAGRAEAMARAMASAVAWLGERVALGTLVVIGGDTARAVLGDEPAIVVGTIAPGVPWCRLEARPEPLVVTRAGGYGQPDSLVALLATAVAP